MFPKTCTPLETSKRKRTFFWKYSLPVREFNWLECWGPLPLTWEFLVDLPSLFSRRGVKEESGPTRPPGRAFLGGPVKLVPLRRFRPLVCKPAHTTVKDGESRLTDVWKTLLILWQTWKTYEIKKKQTFPLFYYVCHVCHNINDVFHTSVTRLSHVFHGSMGQFTN